MRTFVRFTMEIAVFKKSLQLLNWHFLVDGHCHQCLTKLMQMNLYSNVCLPEM